MLALETLTVSHCDRLDPGWLPASSFECIVTLNASGSCLRYLPAGMLSLKIPTISHCRFLTDACLPASSAARVVTLDATCSMLQRLPSGMLALETLTVSGCNCLKVCRQLDPGWLPASSAACIVALTAGSSCRRPGAPLTDLCDAVGALAPYRQFSPFASIGCSWQQYDPRARGADFPPGTGAVRLQEAGIGMAACQLEGEYLPPGRGWMWPEAPSSGPVSAARVEHPRLQGAHRRLAACVRLRAYALSLWTSPTWFNCLKGSLNWPVSWM
jgi:hypothetical protein